MAWSDKAKTGESGLADEYILTISKARYGFPYENAADACALVLDGERNIDGNLDDGHLWLNTGAFEPGDKDGTFAIHESQEVDRHFNKNSKLGKFIKSALESGVPLEEGQAGDRAQYEEKDALIWEGLILKIEEVETTGKLRTGPDAGKEFTSRQPLVREFLGKSDGTAAPAAATPASASPNGPVDEATATQMAKSAPNYIKFLEGIVEAGVSETDRLASQDFFATARA